MTLTLVLLAESQWLPFLYYRLPYQEHLTRMNGRFILELNEYILYCTLEQSCPISRTPLGMRSGEYNGGRPVLPSVEMSLFVVSKTHYRTVLVNWDLILHVYTMNRTSRSKINQTVITYFDNNSMPTIVGLSACLNNVFNGSPALDRRVYNAQNGDLFDSRPRPIHCKNGMSLGVTAKF